MSRRILSISQNSMLLNLPAPIAVVAHDAGGANQIIALLQSHGEAADIHAYMEGPALKLWQRAFPDNASQSSLDEALDGCPSLLSGTGWASDLEFNAIKTASAAGLRTAALLDHWTNYEQRFIRREQTVHPDEFWVVDQYALAIAKRAFPTGNVIQVPDCYLRAQAQQISAPPSNGQTLLYVQEPARSDWGRDRPGEFQALDYMIEKLPTMSLPKDLRILLRPHPSEDSEKYLDWVAQQTDLNVALDNSPTLADAISHSHWVAGCESYALVVALASGRPVYCTLPPWAPACRLPHDGLIQVKSL